MIRYLKTIFGSTLIIPVAIGVTIGLILYFQEGAGIWVCVGFAIGGLLMASLFTLKVDTSDDGVRISYLIPLGRNVFIPWEAIESVEHVDKGRGTDIHINLTTGEVIRFSRMATPKR